MTGGCVTKKLLIHNPKDTLDGVTHIVVDEAHEREADLGTIHTLY